MPVDFELDASSSVAGHDASLLGVWREVGLAGPGTDTAVTRWRVVVPERPGVAAEQLDACASMVGVAEVAVAVAGTRLEQGAALGAAATFSPDQLGGTGRVSGEAELAAWVLAAERAAAASSFGGDPVEGGWLDQAEQELAHFTERTRRWCTPTAEVATEAGGELLGTTLVGLAGRVATVWRSGLGPDAVALHQRAVALVVASRTALLRTVATVVRGAVTIAARLALPGGAVLAMPAVLRFLHHLVSDALRPGRDGSGGPR